MNPLPRGLCRSKWAGVEHGLLGIDRSNIVALPSWIGASLKREGRRRFISEGAQTATSTSSQLAPLKTSSNVAAGSNRGTASSKFACVSSKFRELSYVILVVLWTGPHCLSLTFSSRPARSLVSMKRPARSASAWIIHQSGWSQHTEGASRVHSYSPRCRLLGDGRP